MKRRALAMPLLLAAVFAAGGAAAGESEFTGFAAIDNQAFWLDGRFDGQQDGINPSLLAQPEFYWRSDDGRQRASFVGFARLDAHDDERTHADLREAYWGLDGDGWDMTAGISRIFWGVTESRHLVDVINQTDLVEGIDEESKLGQPLFNVNLQRDYGRFGLFVMPYFRERTFAGVDGRFRGPRVVDTDRPVYESGDEERHVDYALRYSHYVGDVDIGLHLFDGTSREPRFVAAPDGDRLLPVYDQMRQVGLDLQYTSDAWLWKLEAIARDSGVGTFAAAVGGFEYTLYGIGASSADLGLLFEYLYDGRNAQAPPATQDNDVFFGTRFALNDSADTSVLAGIAVDLDTAETFVNVEAERRIGDALSIELQLRSFLNAEPGDTMYGVERDDYLQLRFSWYY